MSAPPLLGLLLAGGRSERMGRDKAALVYNDRTQAEVAFDLLREICGEACVSIRAGQAGWPGFSGKPAIADVREGLGPAGGILSALLARPGSAWLVLGCDLPRMTADALRALVAARDPAACATAFRGPADGLPEPVCAIYEPSFLPLLQQALAEGVTCPRKMLVRFGSALVDAPDPAVLDNVNHPDEFETARRHLRARPIAYPRPPH